MLSEFFRLAAQSILHRKLRSILAVLGVWIGIMAVVLLISFGLSFEGMMKGEVSKIFGADTFIIMDQDTFGQGHGAAKVKQFALNLQTLENVEGVKTVAAIRQRTAFVEGGIGPDGKPTQGFFPVMGLSPQFLTEFKAFTGDQKLEPGGRNITEGDVTVAVLSSELAKRFNVAVGDSILVAGEKSSEMTVSIIGILAPADVKEEQGFASGMGATTSDTIYVPNTAIAALKTHRFTPI